MESVVRCVFLCEIKGDSCLFRTLRISTSSNELLVGERTRMQLHKNFKEDTITLWSVLYTFRFTAHSFMALQEAAALHVILHILTELKFPLSWTHWVVSILSDFGRFSFTSQDCSLCWRAFILCFSLCDQFEKILNELFLIEVKAFEFPLYLSLWIIARVMRKSTEWNFMQFK